MKAKEFNQFEEYGEKEYNNRKKNLYRIDMEV